MSFQIQLQPGEHQFSISEQESVLDAALRQGLNFPYGCRSGYCGACKCRLLNGRVDYATPPEALSVEEMDQNIVLSCQARAQTDLELQVNLLDANSKLQVKKLPCRVAGKQKLTHDVMELGLKLPATERLQFFAGQYIDFLLADGRRRSFSIANAPHDDELIMLHIRHVEGGDFTGHVFNHIKEKDILRIEGPLGGFVLQESDRPLLFMAGGTGFAPVKSMIEHLIAEQAGRSIHLYWGARAKHDLYMHDLAIHWATQHDHILYTPVLSAPAVTDDWTGHKGLVHEAIAAEYPDLSGFDIYASGPPAMVQAGQSAFLKQGMLRERYFSDAFEFQTPKES
ncbi:MAG: CDP-6-deoxy-delta-3,4-glucoseen reductase [Gammaproteobacteria bacterium]|nr:CDP-6-deoxy-delta-3,4-glucoseen reductase [Gammaproteobacteria bacterium]MDH5799562.1 CDP-6-deoxy-delta-3,4-glucoseen reductase [Gammaproteobacteria bacterium]